MTLFLGKTLRRPRSFGFAVVLVGLLNTVATADEVNTNAFVVFSEVTTENSPTIKTETIFVGTDVYDRVDRTGSLIKKFDLDRQLAWILDSDRGRQATLTFGEIREFQAGARARTATQAAGRRDRLTTFMARPQFTTSFDPTSRIVRLESPLMTYEAEVEQGSADVVDRFTEFADWTKQLSTLLDQASLAGPRMRLNEELKGKHFLAKRVTLKIKPGVTATSHHRYVPGLETEQEDFIFEVEEQLKKFPKTSISEFLRTRKTNKVVAKK